MLLNKLNASAMRQGALSTLPVENFLKKRCATHQNQSEASIVTTTAKI